MNGGSSGRTDSNPPGLRERRDGDVVELTLDRPHRRNALTAGLVSALASRLVGLAAEGVRVCVLAGGPPVFCAGGDLTDLNATVEQGTLAMSEVVYQHFHRLVTTMASVPFPIVAAIDGAALGAGLDLALCCDLRVASTRSTFASSWIGVGLVPGMGGAHLLTEAVGSARAHEMVLLGEPVDARRALDWGLVTRVAEPADLAEITSGITQRLAGLPPIALARSKATLRRSAGRGLAEELAALGAIQAGLLTGPEFRDRTARFRRPAPAG
jgi:2-(1,2-epoxy-1,2-dihydrophenyl)acetyl-CoA isomerase